MHNQLIQCFEGFLLNLCYIKDFFELIIGAIFYLFEALVRLFIQPPRKDVEGEIVLVTGAANGIGKLIAKELGRRGATLVLWDVDWEALDETAKELRQILDIRVYAYACDCSRRTEVYKVADMVKREVGDVSILVNNAGVVTGKYTFTEAPDNLVDRTLRVNVAAHFWTYKAFLPAMMSRNHGHLVCVACHGGLFAMNGLADYCASKFAAVGFAESIALEMLVLKKEGVKTTIVAIFSAHHGQEGCSKDDCGCNPEGEDVFTATLQSVLPHGIKKLHASQVGHHLGEFLWRIGFNGSIQGSPSAHSAIQKASAPKIRQHW
nr:epidermal retinol dehydrogenase 2-like isoform X2 [Oncorhynchus nerka]